MGETLKILMLEDLEEDIGLIEYVLKKEGMVFESRYVDTKEQFIRLLQEFEPDVILSDHALPQFNSVEALKITRSRENEIPFILVTGAVSEEFAVSCIKQGADDYVLKSNLVRLPTAIINALKQRSVQQKKKEAEQALRAQNEMLVKINQELDSFVYSVSHNLRAPLMSVLGLTRLVNAEITSNNSNAQDIQKYFEMIEHSISKLDETLKEILDYSRNARSEVQIEKVDIEGLIQDGFERHKFLDGFNDMERKLFVNQKSEFYSDPRRLATIMNNLISNAIKYRDPKKKSIILIDVEITDVMATIIFRDNGIGIPEKMLSKIFNMFFRATDRSEGAGLGLYIVKETIDKLGGNVSTESVLGAGTTFQMQIPNHSEREWIDSLRRQNVEQGFSN